MLELGKGQNYSRLFSPPRKNEFYNSTPLGPLKKPKPVFLKKNQVGWKDQTHLFLFSSPNVPILFIQNLSHLLQDNHFHVVLMMPISPKMMCRLAVIRPRPDEMRFLMTSSFDIDKARHIPTSFDRVPTRPDMT